MAEMAPTSPHPRQAWLLALRPKTLPAAVVPVLVGVAGSSVSGQVQWLPSLAALVGALLLQIGSNFANDVYDHERGADTNERVGPSRAVAAGWVSAGAMKLAMVGVFILAALVGGYLYTVAGWPIAAIGVASIVSAYAYTGGPYPLGYHGLGDLFVLVFFGLVAVAGTFYVNTGSVPPLAWFCAVPVGALCTAILVVNNVRDVETDAVAGKRTLAVRFGRAAGVGEYRGLLATAYLCVLLLVIATDAGFTALLPLVTLAHAFKLQRSVAQDRGPTLNATLAGTARLLLTFGALLALGLALSSAPWRAGL